MALRLSAAVVRLTAHHGSAVPRILQGQVATPLWDVPLTHVQETDQLQVELQNLRRAARAQEEASQQRVLDLETELRQLSDEMAGLRTQCQKLQEELESAHRKQSRMAEQLEQEEFEKARVALITSLRSGWQSPSVPSTIRRPWHVFQEHLDDNSTAADPGLRRQLALVQRQGAVVTFRSLVLNDQRPFVNTR